MCTLNNFYCFLQFLLTSWPIWTLQSSDYFPLCLHFSAMSQLRRPEVGQTRHVRGPEKRLPSRLVHCPLTPGMKSVCVCVCAFGVFLMHWVFSFNWCSICGSIHGDNDLQSWKRGGRTSGCVYLAHMGEISALPASLFTYSNKWQSGLKRDKGCEGMDG